MVDVITTDEFQAWYLGLSEDQQMAVTHSVSLLEQLGVSLPFPHSSDLKGAKFALRELRVNTAVIRIAYAFDPKRDAVLLIGGSKEGDTRFYRWFIPQAETIWAQYLKEQGYADP
jgi:hypothetical protein